MVEDTDRRARISAVFGVFAFLDVPLVYVSTAVFFGGPEATISRWGQA